MGAELAAVLLSLAAAVSWGGGDFNGGLASKKRDVVTVIAMSQLIGMIALTAVAAASGEPLAPARDLLLGAAAGIVGAIGLLGLFRGLARDRMGVVAPLTAVTGAGVPVLAELALEGLPQTPQLAGIGFALASVWIISAPEGGGLPKLGQLALPLSAGISFGLFFILIDQLNDAFVYWPLVAARAASVAVFGPLSLALNRRRNATQPLPRLPITLAGLLDTAGNVFFALATTLGRLDIAAVLGALYPAATVLLAWRLLREPISKRLGLGLATALFAVVLIAL